MKRLYSILCAAVVAFMASPVFAVDGPTLPTDLGLTTLWPFMGLFIVASLGIYLYRKSHNVVTKS